MAAPGPGQGPGFVYNQPAQPNIGSYPQYGTGQTFSISQEQSAGGAGQRHNDGSSLFAEKEIRTAFISKVYSILTIQLIFSTILIGLFVLNPSTKSYFAHSQGWLFLGMAIFMVPYFILVCVESARRSTPMNMLLLCVMTFGYSLVAAITSCRYDTRVVLFAFLATGISCLLITAFARTTKFDLTNCGTTLCLLGLGHMLVGTVLVAILVPLGYAKVGALLLAISGALLASLYLVFDLQLIMGGRKCELSPEEYILGAVMLYTDIMQIFIYLLEIIQSFSSD